MSTSKTIQTLIDTDTALSMRPYFLVYKGGHRHPKPPFESLYLTTLQSITVRHTPSTILSLFPIQALRRTRSLAKKSARRVHNLLLLEVLARHRLPSDNVEDCVSNTEVRVGYRLERGVWDEVGRGAVDLYGSRVDR
ncbi:hypothetical protein L202_04435 [Cryptococcus amylolentus CBS 6039]|uniref:Uncharacterized protein n=1 Tax=Cryptococcus amylolentus CBS 6039 TaxID=1295533 RepID=A0A1E3HRB9_9TREE|nr:hypothetical protein L202_04435 [Cryptococcus amylolentus CBS 6039]ODN78908.1 hypothetical protein L202_04435 [Cryptococcus amylolentus CBS 6039]